MHEHIAALALPVVGVERLVQWMPGEMLRTRMAGRLLDSGLAPSGRWTVARACAAAEMAYGALYCHRDVMTGGPVLSGKLALSSLATRSGAVLVGDILLCEAMDMVLGTGDGVYARAFVARVREASQAEVEQELRLRDGGSDCRPAAWLARARAGPLFAFIGEVCGGEDGALSAALAEAGYHVAAACQHADELFDVIGLKDAGRRTLSADVVGGATAVRTPSRYGSTLLRECIRECCDSALDCLRPWPQARRGLAEFLAGDLEPTLGRRAMQQPLGKSLP